MSIPLLRPHSILIVGCGLIGVSLAKCLRDSNSEFVVDGIEVRPDLREALQSLDTFRTMYDEIPLHTHYDVAVLAVPIEAACILLPTVSRCATVVFDVASVKQPICDAAAVHQIQNYVPTHPMAGTSDPNPLNASGQLFTHRPWIVLKNYLYSDWVGDFLIQTGCRLEWMETAAVHDKVVSLVSHMIHVGSLANAITYKRGQEIPVNYSHFTGPAFADITRLADSPVEFWSETLQKNRDNLVRHLGIYRDVLDEIMDALCDDDNTRIRQWLLEAREGRQDWKRAKE